MTTPHNRSRTSETPPLLGRVLVCSLYVGLDGKPWSDEEIGSSHLAMLRAGKWVENQAARWSAPVNIEISDTFFSAEVDEPGEVLVDFVPEGDDVGPFEKAAGFKSMVMATRAAVSLSFQDFPLLAAEIEALTDADAVVWMLHLRRAGRSFAPHVDEVLVQGLKVAVCYCHETSFPERLAGPARTDPVTVVHEMLHLFGASDKYGRRPGSYDRNAVSHWDVMSLNEDRLSRMRVDRQTAMEIGWIAR